MILYCGDMIFNTGPANVNRAYRDELKGRMYFLRAKNRALSFLETFFVTWFAEKIILSGVNSRTFLALHLGRLLHRDVFYLMHSCAKKEAEINGERPQKARFLRKRIQEETFLKKCTRIICVSERLMELCKGWLPEFADKMTFVTNGVERIPPHSGEGVSRKRNYIVVTGGGRRLKRNLNVAKAIERINRTTGGDLKLIVLGNDWGDCDALRQCACVDYVGQVPHDDVYAYFRQSSIFIQNSVMDSFPASVFEALQCGCDVLVSKNVGCIPVLEGLTEDYIISDVDDIDEIAGKIQYCIAHPNNQAILERIDWDALSYRAAAERLYEVVTGET